MSETDNSKIINNINQILHNKGVKQEDRLDKLLYLLNNKNEIKELDNLLNKLDRNNKELMQEIFMLFGNKFTKYKLDQFYTPLTISEFINNLMTFGNSEKAIDPAGGTGDLLIHYQGNKTIWDIDDNALKLCKLNYDLNKHKNYNLECKNSLRDYIPFENTFDYSVLNPPFGSNTLITDQEILNNFVMGKGKKKQEIGILFVELGLKLLKDNGIMFIIIPSGYVGNSNNNCSEMRNLILENKVLASIELPRNTFKRSGTGVNTYLLIVQKKKTKKDYPILISRLNNIGYNLKNKNTPVKYKVEKSTGKVLLDKYKNKIRDNDFNDLKDQITLFIKKAKIKGLNKSNNDKKYEYIRSNSLENNIIDVKRYMKSYKSVISEIKNGKYKRVKDLCKILNSKDKIEDNKEYLYIDISEINTPLYNGKELYGYELPSRAKYSLKKYDILVSKLEGDISYCVILDDNNNYISTNGVCVLRCEKIENVYILFGNLINKKFKVQHEAFLTGSIMACLSDDELGNILVSTEIDTKQIKSMLKALEEYKKISN